MVSSLFLTQEMAESILEQVKFLHFQPTESSEWSFESRNTSMYRPKTSKQSFKEMSLPASDHRRSTSGTK
jgi:hypothetical protein